MVKAALVVAALGLAFVAHVPLNPVGIVVSTVAGDDKSFFAEIDENEWPGDGLSEKQFLAAVDHFKDDSACAHPWGWALIGPNEFLLKGTHYHIVRAVSAATPNTHIVKGYWGSGIDVWLSPAPIALVKQEGEAEAAKDCLYGVTP